MLTVMHTYVCRLCVKLFAKHTLNLQHYPTACGNRYPILSLLCEKWNSAKSCQILPVGPGTVRILCTMCYWITILRNAPLLTNSMRFCVINWLATLIVRLCDNVGIIHQGFMAARINSPCIYVGMEGNLKLRIKVCYDDDAVCREMNETEKEVLRVLLAILWCHITSGSGTFLSVEVLLCGCVLQCGWIFHY